MITKDSLCSFLGTNNNLYACYSPASKLIKSTDLGKTWREVSCPSISGFFNAQTLFGISFRCGSNLYFSKDDGETFAEYKDVPYRKGFIYETETEKSLVFSQGDYMSFAISEMTQKQLSPYLYSSTLANELRINVLKNVQFITGSLQVDATVSSLGSSTNGITFQKPLKNNNYKCFISTNGTASLSVGVVNKTTNGFTYMLCNNRTTSVTINSIDWMIITQE